MSILKKVTFSLAVICALSACQSLARDPLFRLTLRVVDDASTPVVGAQVRIGAERRSKEGESEGKGIFAEGVTDDKGLFTGEVEAWDATRAGYSAEKAGYYPVRQRSYSAKASVRGRWQPWNPTIEVVLKRIRNPVPMYAKRVERGLPALGETVSYDLESGDWLPPHGKGKIADMAFLGTLKKLDQDNGDYEVTVSFSNPGDGIQRFTPDRDTPSFRSPYEAPDSGYRTEWKLKQIRRRGLPDVTDFDSKGAYFFRVRTVLGKDGKVVKALYGKIYGDFFEMVYYLNPDGTRNVEYDTKRNLLKPVGNKDRRYYEVGP